MSGWVVAVDASTVARPSDTALTTAPPLVTNQTSGETTLGLRARNGQRGMKTRYEEEGS
jgi:hypothetical protein